MNNEIKQVLETIIIKGGVLGVKELNEIWSLLEQHGSELTKTSASKACADCS